MPRKKSDLQNTLVGLSTHEITQRFGEANAEFLKGLRGVDYQTGQHFDRSLIGVANYKVHADYLEQNLKQQAGYSAEIGKVSRQNAENIITENPRRLIRSEDVPGFGKNHDRVDLLELIDGKVVSGSESQVKFVDNYRNLLKNIAAPGGENSDLSRYRDVAKLELPTEQVSDAREYCLEQAESYYKQADRVRENGNIELADKLRLEAENFEALEKKITDSGMTTAEALEYRRNPVVMTARDMATTSHKAGMEGAKFGAAIGGSISLITNIIAVRAGDKEFSEAAVSVAVDSGKAAGVGYMTTFAGSAIKSFMAQSPSEYTRALSNTCLPSLAVSVCMATSKSIYRYTAGEINEEQLLHELGNTASGMVSSSMFAALGQIAIPVPVLGGVIGGMVGYTVSNVFYHAYTQAIQDARLSEEHLIMTQMKCNEAIRVAEQYRLYVKDVIDRKIIVLEEETTLLFNVLNADGHSIDHFAAHVNRFALSLGKKIQFETMNEFEQFMASDDDLIL